MKSGRTFCIGCGVFFLLFVVILTVSLLTESINKLPDTKVALILNRDWYKLHKEPKSTGLHVGPVNFAFVTFPAIFRKLEYEDVTCLNYDGLYMYLDVQIHYRASVENLDDIVLRFRDSDTYEDYLEIIGSGAIARTCSFFSTATVLEKRNEVEALLTVEVEKDFLKAFAEVKEVNLLRVKRDSQYESLIIATDTALQKIKVRQQERQAKLVTAETEMKTAALKGEVDILKAKNEANNLVTQAKGEAKSTIIRFLSDAKYYNFILKGGYSYNFTHVTQFETCDAITASRHPVSFDLSSLGETFDQPFNTWL